MSEFIRPRCKDCKFWEVKEIKDPEEHAGRLNLTLYLPTKRLDSLKDGVLLDAQSAAEKVSSDSLWGICEAPQLKEEKIASIYGQGMSNSETECFRQTVNHRGETIFQFQFPQEAKVALPQQRIGLKILNNIKGFFSR